MNTTPDCHPEKPESGQQTCPTCVHFIPYQDGCKDGRCTIFMGSYCSHTTADHSCHIYEPKQSTEN